ncbi:MAG: hypothetical protein M1300_07460 [Epsilonproteobacteria bacterium]|nr:hypothetical protein [Campylobacterota bacterium]
MAKKAPLSGSNLEQDFNSIVDQVLAKNQNKKMLKSALWQKLDSLKEGIKRLRQENVPYKNIVQIIGDVTERHGERLKVSEQTLRAFCQEALDLPKVYRKQVSKTDENTEK